MKILASADLHNNKQFAQALAHHAVHNEVDLVILCGDLGHAGHLPQEILGPFVEQQKKVLFVPGNHDAFVTAQVLAHVYGTTNMHNNTAVYGNVGFFGCGGANIGPQFISEEDVYTALEQSHNKLPTIEHKILISHMHPKGSVMEKISGCPGSQALRGIIEKFQPTLVLCGHIHEASGIEEKIGDTVVMNVAGMGKVLEFNEF
ncbi:MAG: metallophosphoesterase family protein [Candidatus Woesearchaeota archaeon]